MSSGGRKEARKDEIYYALHQIMMYEDDRRCLELRKKREKERKKMYKNVITHVGKKKER